MRHTETDFDRLSWHDCHLWGLELRAGDPDAGDWTSDLALDIDLDRDSFAWRISLNWPAGGEIAFGAAGFTQTLR